MSARTTSTIHPGEVLLLQYVEPLGVNHRLALAIGVPPRRINEHEAMSKDAGVAS